MEKKENNSDVPLNLVVNFLIARIDIAIENQEEIEEVAKLFQLRELLLADPENNLIHKQVRRVLNMDN